MKKGGDAKGPAFEGRHFRPGFNPEALGHSNKRRTVRQVSLLVAEGPPVRGIYLRTNELSCDQLEREKSAHSNQRRCVPGYGNRRSSPSPSPRIIGDYYPRSQRDRPSHAAEDVCLSAGRRVSSRVSLLSLPTTPTTTAQSRNSDIREPNASQTYFSAQSTLCVSILELLVTSEAGVGTLSFIRNLPPEKQSYEQVLKLVIYLIYFG